MNSSRGLETRESIALKNLEEKEEMAVDSRGQAQRKILENLSKLLTSKIGVTAEMAGSITDHILVAASGQLTISKISSISICHI